MEHLNIFAFEMNFIVLLIVVGIVIIALITMYLCFAKGRYKKASKKVESKIEKTFGDSNKIGVDLMNDLYASKSYNGKFKSFNSKEKKEAKKFLKDWMELVPTYIALNQESEKGKYKRIYIVTLPDVEGKPNFKKSWTYKQNKKSGWNMKKLISFMNKYKIARSTMDVLVNLYTAQVHPDEMSEDPVGFENNLYIKYIIK